MVRERFGGPACRIFRLLLLKRNLEQKQIAEMVTLLFYMALTSVNVSFSFTGDDTRQGHSRITL